MERQHQYFKRQFDIRQYIKNDNGTFTQTGGKTDVLGTGFDLDNASDIISAGTLNIGNKTTTSDLTVSAGTIESDATINITKKVH